MTFIINSCRVMKNSRVITSHHHQMELLLKPVVFALFIDSCDEESSSCGFVTVNISVWCHLPSSCWSYRFLVNSLCQTMKWASAGTVHGMPFPGCGHISPRTASLTPIPFAAIFAAKVHTHSPTLPLVSSLHQIQFLLLHAPCRAQEKGVREAVLGEMCPPFPLLYQFQFLLLRAPRRAQGRGSGRQS